MERLGLKSAGLQPFYNVGSLIPAFEHFVSILAPPNVDIVFAIVHFRCSVD